MGVFDYVPGVTSGGKPVYKKEAPTTEYLFYWPEAGYEHWLIGPSYTENSASVHSGGNGTECPTAETSWSVYSLTGCPFWCTGYEISVTCASDPPPAHMCTTTALTIAGAENIQGGYMGTYEKLAIAGTVYNDGKPVFYKADPVGGPSFIFYKAHCVDSTFCGNFGSYTNDGQCDDGGAGASGAYCDLGTDCTDCGPRGEWMVGPDYADTSQAFYIYSDAACPPESGWSMWLASNNDYTMAYVVSVLADPDPPFTACACKQVLVSGADAVAPNLMGTYTWLPGVSADSNTCNSQGRPVYYNAAAGKYLHYCPGSDGNDWYISNDYATLWDNVDSASSWGSLSATCPSGSTDWRVSLTKPVCTSKTDCPCGAAVGNADAAKAACAACGYNGYDYTNDGINGIYQYQCSDQGVTLDTIYEVSGAAYIQYWTESGEYPFTFTCAPDPPPPPPPALPPGVLSSPPPPPPPTPHTRTCSNTDPLMDTALYDNPPGSAPICVIGYRIRASFIVTGDIASFDAEALRASLRTQLGCMRDAGCEVLVAASSGSVRLDVHVLSVGEPTQQGAAMKQQVEDALNNRQGTLGITLEMLLEVTLFPEGQEVPILDESLSGSFTSANSVPESGGGVVGIAIGVVGGVVAVLVAVLVYCYCKKKQRQPPAKSAGVQMQKHDVASASAQAESKV